MKDCKSKTGKKNMPKTFKGKMELMKEKITGKPAKDKKPAKGKDTKGMKY